jgi:hypothetical protein
LVATGRDSIAGLLPLAIAAIYRPVTRGKEAVPATAGTFESPLPRGGIVTRGV